MPFQDVLAANSTYTDLHERAASGSASKGLAIVTCIDSRIRPLAAFGMGIGDIKIIRNAGARVTDDVLRSLLIAVHALDVNRIALIQHTDCAGANATQESLAELVRQHTGNEVGDFDFLTIDDQEATLRSDAQKIRDCPLMPDDIEVGGFIFDIDSGALTQLA